MPWNLKLRATLIFASACFFMGTMLFLRRNLSVQNDTPHRLDTPLYQHDQHHQTGVGQIFLKDFTKLPGVQRLLGPNVAWDDPELVKLIREELLDTRRPTMTKISYPLFQTPQAKAVDGILKKKRKGFFVECGALDGERSSNTIWLEFERDWTGLLVEMDPSYYLQIRGKNRNVHSINVCLSPEKYPLTVNFKEDLRGAGRVDDKNSTGADILPTLCIPFYSIMLAMNRTQIDYFSLDVEGFELPILRTIPFDKLDISVITSEYRHLAKWGNETKDTLDDTVKFLTSKNYNLHSKVEAYVQAIYFGARDYVFVKKDLQV